MTAAPAVGSAGQAEAGSITIGIDVGGTKMLGVALGPGSETLVEARRPTPRSASASERSADSLLEVLAEVATEVLGALGPSAELVRSVGLGLPGLVDDGGTLHFAPNLPAADGVEVAPRLAQRLGLRVVSDNDATCATAAEWVLGAGAGVSDLVVATLGTGIGGGLVCGGRLMRGSNGFAGEVGHMVVDPGGPRCPCGKRGCWERFASGSGLARLAGEAAHAGRIPAVVELAGNDPDAVRGEHVTEVARGGDPGAQAVLEELAWWIALGLSNLALALDPECIVVGGGLVEAVDLVMDSVRAAFVSLFVGAEFRPVVRIEKAALGERAGAIGAALVARDDDRHGAGRAPGPAC